ncbi:SWIM zinc finger family protein [Bacillus sp. CLL-7-23]|uniref:SWIM zinc finger family protein n=1 Tax=Bacillus changyiensis TaxID=3004103 RepID=A0ABT4WZJ0_9BACI|nr:SWIM zinc finger family protein [Bacillus changyiensis]MDA7025445.1 SWIM zinc finger family protein [Bacillus changyiensis]
MLQEMISKTVVMEAGEQLKNVLPSNEENIQLMKKALILYRQDCVYRVKPLTNYSTTAYVQDVVPVKVHINLSDVIKSDCSCPAIQPCRHVLAVYLYLYAQYDRLGTFTENWKKHNQHLPLNQLQFKVNDESETLENWIRFFETEFERWEERTPEKQQNIQYLYFGYYTSIKKRSPSEPQLNKIYQIHAALATWFSIDQLFKNGRIHPEQDFLGVNPYIEQLMDTIHSSIDQLITYALSFSLDPFLEKTPAVIRKLLFINDPFHYERLKIFQIMWSALLARPKWLKKELEILTEMEPSPTIQFGRYHLEFLLKNDDDILEKMDDFSPTMLPHTFQWLDMMTMKKDWKRLKKWYDSLQSLTTRFCKLNRPYQDIREVLSEFLLMLGDYSRQTKDDPLYEKYCQCCLPYTFTEYSGFLYGKNRFVEWMELHSLIGFSIAEIGQKALKDIAVSAPEALIPSYHREISALIEQRNRTAYKQAVKYLKKLRTLYKKVKKQHIWKQYMKQLTTRHKRLRAFQEELRKGKLIDES